MENVRVEHDPNYLRAKTLLEGSITTPEYLINLWKLMPVCHGHYPYPEKMTPWNFGIESLTS